MQATIKFILTPQMTMYNKDNLTAIGRSSLLATWVTITTPMTYNRLATIEFEDPDILQQKETGRYTNYYHVIIGEVTEEDMMLSLWVAKDHVGFVVAMQYRSEEEIELSDNYKAFPCERKLTEAEIKEIFASIFQNPSVIEPVELSTGDKSIDNLPYTE
ncbi:hypothetical protein [Puia dinghuensis]|nr:hypothetical protein [Puia dinghuensis]